MKEQSTREILIGSIVYHRLLAEGPDGVPEHPEKEWKGRVKNYICVHIRPDLSLVIVESLEDDPEYKGQEEYIIAGQITRIEKDQLK